MSLPEIQFDLQEMTERLLKTLEPNMLQIVTYSTLMLRHMCESPIEVALGASFLVSDRLYYLRPNMGVTLAWASDEKSYREDAVLLIPQFPWKGYRIDFALRLPRYRFGYMFIECDGHDFHERTKEQAARDRAKDRLIQQAGYPILRFTGSEIHRNAGNCADQIFDFVNERTDIKA